VAAITCSTRRRIIRNERNRLCFAAALRENQGRICLDRRKSAHSLQGFPPCLDRRPPRCNRSHCFLGPVNSNSSQRAARPVHIMIAPTPAFHVTCGYSLHAHRHSSYPGRPAPPLWTTVLSTCLTCMELHPFAPSRRRWRRDSCTAAGLAAVAHFAASLCTTAVA
jgi:hypothetical protein